MLIPATSASFPQTLHSRAMEESENQLHKLRRDTKRLEGNATEAKLAADALRQQVATISEESESRITQLE